MVNPDFAVALIWYSCQPSPYIIWIWNFIAKIIPKVTCLSWLNSFWHTLLTIQTPGKSGISRMQYRSFFRS